MNHHNPLPKCHFYSLMRKKAFQKASGPIQNFVLNSVIFVNFFFFLFLGPHVWHIEVPRLGVKSGLQLPTYTTATATQDLCSICNLHHSSWQHRILNPLSEARDCTHTLIDISQVPNPLSHNGNSFKYLFNDEISRHFIFHSP